MRGASQARSPAEELVRDASDIMEHAGGATMLLVPAAVVEILNHQAREEGVSPGEVLNHMIVDYLERKGSQEARDYFQRYVDARQVVLHGR